MPASGFLPRKCRRPVGCHKASSARPSTFTRILATTTLAFLQWHIYSASPDSGTSDADHRLAAYFSAETRRLADACLADLHSLEDWQAKRAALRHELFEMLSLSPLPERTDLKPVVTGKLEQETFTVEKLQFQSMPGLYVTGDLYVPRRLEKRAPAVLYVCGHALVATNGISYGNKTAYQHHGAWFARNGFVCLIIDTVQLGEIQGTHHGTYLMGRWWWNSRGYTPAGVEAWNCIRALDYLQSRTEVDGERLGVTGRSGGGAYSWWLAALDDRIKAAAPVAGITDLQNHVVDGTVEGHCDCMFMLNTYRWDYPAVAALVAPRPLLIGNSDKDSIFPLDGVVRLHAKVDRIYQLYGATNNLGLLITEGPHKDTQDLQLPVFRWFNRHLKGEDPIIEMAATRFFSSEQLKVFDSLPADERTSRIDESFLPVSNPELPRNSADWQDQCRSWKAVLAEKVFRGWPDTPPPLHLVTRGVETRGLSRIEVYAFTSQHDVQLRFYITIPDMSARATALRLTVLDQNDWRNWVIKHGPQFPKALRLEQQFVGSSSKSDSAAVAPGNSGEIQVCFAPRGLGLDAWSGNERKQTQIRRRFMLLGQTVDGMRVWDIRRAIKALRSIEELRGLPITLEAESAMAVNAAYAAIFEPGVETLRLAEVPASHRTGPDYLNVLRFLDVSEALAMAANTAHVELLRVKEADWSYPTAVSSRVGWPADQFRIEEDRDR
jgi:dienelactone hydrolase